jgi:hypothetical protein
MMRKFIVAALVVASAAAGARAQSQSAPTLRIVAEDGNRLPAELMYGNTKVKPLRLRPGTNTPITIRDTDFFVQQQYVDFLGRFPDQGGFAFWQGNITQCGNDQGCIAAQRVNVSAAFFLSIEFQETGFLVYRFYRASLPKTSARPRGLPRYLEFMRDTQRIGEGVVVGTPGWEAELAANQRAFAIEFVQRAEFVARYPTTMSPVEFVDALYANAGVTPSEQERAEAIAQFRGTAQTTDISDRANVLRRVADNATFRQREFNPAFVLMEYFGYLRRNPNDPPDTDFAGYDFWLNKLNSSPDFRQAEMVEAFISSIEYRARFGRT